MITTDEKSADEAFEQLLIKIANNKELKLDSKNEDDKKELLILKNLMQHYAEHGDKSSYNKIIRLLNIFIDPELETSLEQVSKSEDFDKIQEKNKQNHLRFPILSLLYRMTQDDQASLSEKPNAAYQQLIKFLNENNGNLTDKELKLLDPQEPVHDIYGNQSSMPHIDGHPKGMDPNDLSTLPYSEMVEIICQRAVKRAEAAGHIFDSEKTKNLEILKKELVTETYKRAHWLGLENLIELYRDDLNIVRLLKVPHLMYVDGSFRTGEHWFYPNTSVSDILPHPVFKTVLQVVQDLDLFEIPSNFRAVLLGKLISEKQKLFSGFSVLPKDTGGDPGFILQSPDKMLTYYCKRPKNMFVEYFYASVMSKMGIKMAESFLIKDEFDNVFFLTASLTRTYKKGDNPKSKVYSNMIYAVNAPTVGFDLPFHSAFLPVPEQEAELKKFLETTFNTTSRVSFAKILIVGVAFDLKDLVAHGGNIGLLITESSKKGKITKMGVVDFTIEPEEITDQDKIDFKDEISKKMKSRYTLDSMQDIFAKMYERLSPEDFAQAASELKLLKQRHLTEEGFLIQYSSERSIPFKDVIEKTAVLVKQRMKKWMSEEGFERYVKILDTCKARMIKNLDIIIDELTQDKPLEHSEEEQKREKEKLSSPEPSEQPKQKP